MSLTQEKLTLKEIQKIRSNPAVRKECAQGSLEWFTWIYFSHYIKSDVPFFHYDIYNDLQNEELNFYELIAFRNSAKSTIASLAYPIWEAVVKRNKKFILLISDTNTQTKQIIANIIAEFENNKMLIEDFGAFEGREEWTKTNIILESDCQIMSRSRGQKVRGLRFKEHRPDLIIVDDVESTDDVRTKEGRDKTEEWFYSEVRPSLDTKKGKIVLVGNLLHLDSFYVRVKDSIQKNPEKGELYREFSLYDENGKNRWSDEISESKIRELKKKPRYFQREYLLKIVPDEGQVIKKIYYYDKLPEITALAIGVDLAISQKESADCTAINVAATGEDGKYYNIYNVHGHYTFNETLETLNQVYERYNTLYPEVPCQIGWEDVAYQRVGIEEAIRRYQIPIKGVPRAKDKRSRLQTIGPYFDSQQILLRKEGDEDLALQILNFGIERYDDLMDAAEISYNLLINEVEPAIMWI